MDKLKYSQELKDIKQMLVTSVKCTLNNEDLNDFEEECLAIDFLIATESGLASKDNLIRPSNNVLMKAFNRYLQFLDRNFECNYETVDKYPSPTIAMQFRTCTYYFNILRNSNFLEDKPEEILNLVGILEKNK